MNNPDKINPGEPLTSLRMEMINPSNQHPVFHFKKRFDTGENFRIHYHRSLEINYCVDISGFIYIEGKPYPLDDKKLIILPPETLHGYQILPHSKEITIFHFSLDLLGEILNMKSLSTRLNMDRNYITYFPENIEAIENCLRAGEENNWENQYKVGIAVLHIIAALKSLSPDMNLHKPNPQLKRIITYTEKHSSEKVLIDDVSRHVGLSKYHFCRFFKEKTGETYIQYLTAFRLENSFQLLQEGYDVGQAGFESGFENISYFIKKFKEKYGLTPGDLRKHNGKEKRSRNKRIDFSGSQFT
jgi:AraC-like DNA-binding protein/quercetin dioxygenase-like cupin family protein